MLWCARLLIAEVHIASDKVDDAQSILDELGESNAFLPFLRARFASIRSELCRRRGDFAEAVRFAADSVAIGGVGPRYNYGEDPLQLRYALALHACGEVQQACDVIRASCDDLQARAARIQDNEVRRAYLENIGAHARIFDLAKEWCGT